MILIPAIDIMDGKCVRLTMGDFASKTVYYDNPQDVAKMWEEYGAKRIHIVDLDGAKEGRIVNYKAIEQIKKSCSMEIEVGGGIRSREAVDYFFSAGIDFIILGTAAVYDRELLLYTVSKYGERIIVGIDSKDGNIAVHGWLTESKLKDAEFANEIKALGIKTVIYTDISKDGMLEGPNFGTLEDINSTGLNIIASGGITTISDLKKLKEIGVYGAILGKALYTGKLDFKKALEVI